MGGHIKEKVGRMSYGTAISRSCHKIYFFALNKPTAVVNRRRSKEVIRILKGFSVRNFKTFVKQICTTDMGVFALLFDLAGGNLCTGGSAELDCLRLNS